MTNKVNRHINPLFNISTFNICTKKNILKLVENGLIEFAPQTEEISMQSFFAMRIRELYESKRFQKCVFIYKMLEKSEKENKYKFIFLLHL